ncbi:DUF5723 family protein [Flavobacterium sp. CHNK8]|uniref:DUF5723 family protein n=1 Tax=Flavobacterium sp. CHNK8 TaxID=2871165 RepID=UPI001C8E0D8D|nr:DUF5723 family protein [Flavobacterium sp. CHNK8]QZK89838.1 DUF5723 family protein [Flavobacterium sp. CHNK8]
MKKIIHILTLLVAFCSWSQNKQILYNFTAIPQSLMTNPGADFKYKWYAGVPLLSGVSANVGSSGFSTYDLFANDGIDFNTKLRNVVLATNRNDKLVVNQQMEIFNGGFRISGANRDDSDTYVSFGMYQEFDMMSYMPKDLAILAIDGNSNYLGKIFDLGDLSMKAELLSVWHIGVHKNISKNFIVGVRGKIYSSIYNANSTKNSGYIYTGPSNIGVYDQSIYSNMQLNTSGLAKYDDENNESDVVKDITNGALLGGNLGLGFDAGFTYYPLQNIQITGSILDVGFINHTKDVESYTLKGRYNYRGIVPSFSSGASAENIYKEFQEAIPLDTINSKYTTWRPIKLNSSFEYSFDEDSEDDCNCKGNGNEAVYKSAVGAQLFVMSTPRMPMFAFTTYFSRKILKGLQAKATYTLDTYSSKNIGLGLSTTAGPINFYLMADNLLEYKDLTKANSLSFQLGFNVIVK